MDKQAKSVSLTAEQRTALHTICRRRKGEALVWKHARAFILLDDGYDAKTICKILEIGPTVLTEWTFAFAGASLSFFGLKDYSQRQGHLFAAQETALAAHFSNTPASCTDEICAYIPAEYDQSYRRVWRRQTDVPVGLPCLKSPSLCPHRRTRPCKQPLSLSMRP